MPSALIVSCLLTRCGPLQEMQQFALSNSMHPAVSLLDSELFTEKGRIRLVRRARLVTYASLAVTLAGGLSGIVAALTLDRFLFIRHSPR
jgi:hypothetical protein